MSDSNEFNGPASSKNSKTSEDKNKQAIFVGIGFIIVFFLLIGFAVYTNKNP